VHLDNASFHTSRQASAFLTGQNVGLIGLAPNYIFLFPHIKRKIRGQRLSSPEYAVEGFKSHVLVVSQAKWEKCFDNWFENIQECMNLAEEYFEKQ